MPCLYNNNNDNNDDDNNNNNDILAQLCNFESTERHVPFK